jgi:hypothetical protein
MVHKQAQSYDGRQCFAWCFRVQLLFRRGCNCDRLRDTLGTVGVACRFRANHSRTTSLQTS